MRRRLTLARESLSELSFADLTHVVGGAMATGEWSCDLDTRLLTPVTGPGISDTTPCNTGTL